jgi:hypothetical protein
VVDEEKMMPELEMVEAEITIPMEIKPGFGGELSITQEIATGETQTGRKFRVIWIFNMGMRVELLDEDDHVEISATPDLTVMITECVTALLSASAQKTDPEELGVVDQEPVTIEES